jgi:RimJ/RimL family protein N-acetyltransferase
MTTPIIAIRPWRIEDASALAVAINNKNVQDNLRDGLPFPYTEKDAAEFITAMLNTDPHDKFAFAVTLDDEAVGSIGVFRQDNIHRRTGELGYYIAEKHWGNGYMTEAVRQICRYVFEHTDIIRIFAEPFAHNEASCRVLEKAGFQYEGTLRANAVKLEYGVTLESKAPKNGGIIDMKMYALINEGACDERQ